MSDDAHDVLKHIQACLRPTPRITPIEWAEANRHLPSSVASRPGRYSLDALPMLREPLMHLSVHSKTRMVAIMKAAQMGWSELALSALGYWIDLAPGPAIVAQPTDDALALFVHQRVRSLIRDTPVIAQALESMPGNSANSLMTLELPGAIVKFASASAEADLQSMPARYIIADEVDRWPATVGRSGDPMDVVTARMTSYEGREKFVAISTPSVKGSSRIEKAYLEGDQREWWVPCPLCGVFQVLRPEGLSWTPGDASAVTYTCEACHGPIEERHKTEMDAAGEWRPKEPSHPYPSYWISGLSRPRGWAGWRSIAAKWDKARTDPERMRALVNLEFGLPDEPQTAQSYAIGDLATHVETYRADCPAGVCVLTGGVDAQTGDGELGQRLEYSVYGWGSGYESWLITRGRIMGRLDDVDVYRRVAEVMSATYTHEADPRGMTVAAVCWDTGGHHAQYTHEFLRPHYATGRRWYAVKGLGGESRPIWPQRSKISRRYNSPLWLVGVDGAKSAWMQRVTIQAPGPGFLHVPSGTPDEYWSQLTAERMEYHIVRGRTTQKWVLPAHRRNEALDCAVYALAALHSLESEGLPLERIVDERAASVAMLKRPSAPVALPTPPPAPRRMAPVQPRASGIRPGWGRR